MQVTPKEIIVYVSENDKSPFEEWVNNLNDLQGKNVIRKRLNRIRLGNLGDFKSVGEGVHEIRIDFGPGYRIYYADLDKKIILLLCGGDKKTQPKNILNAQKYLKEYLQNEQRGNNETKI